MVAFDVHERSKYWCFRGHFVIPAMIVRRFVTSIGASASYAFAGCSDLSSIEIYNSVISIGDYAFRDRSGLISVEIPNSVITIGANVFLNCRGLTSMKIPNSVSSIGVGAFFGYLRLKSIAIPKSVITIGDEAFYACEGFSLPMRKLFPYKWVNALNLSSTFEYVFEFLSWQDLARMTEVSKYFYSNVMVRCRKDFMYNRVGESIVIESDRPAELCIIGSVQCVSLDRRVELALYSSDCSGVSSVCVPLSFQEAAPAVVEVRKK